MIVKEMVRVMIPKPLVLTCSGSEPFSQSVIINPMEELSHPKRMIPTVEKTINRCFNSSESGINDQPIKIIIKNIVVKNLPNLDLVVCSCRRPLGSLNKYQADFPSLVRSGKTILNKNAVEIKRIAPKEKAAREVVFSLSSGLIVRDRLRK